MIVPRRTGALLGAVFLAMAIAPGIDASQNEDVLREQDVVRMLLSGDPVGQVIERIRTSPVDFDLSEEMVAELLIAGVPEAVVDAMKARQRELSPTAENAEPEDEASGEPGPVLRITLRTGDDKSKKKKKKDREEDEGKPETIRIDEYVDPGLAAQWQLSGADERVFTDVAIYVACVTSYHVPDHWRSKTPIGRDFFSMPRHKMLAFAPGAEWEKAGFFKKLGMSIPGLATSGTGGTASSSVTSGKPKSGTLEYPIPPTIEIALKPGEPHDIVLGIALEIDGRFYRFTDAMLEDVTVVNEDVDVVAIVETPNNLATLKIYFEKGEEEDDDLTADAN